MSVKEIIVGRIDKARSFAESVRSVYEDAYKKAVDTSKGGFGGLVKDIEPKLRNVIDEGLHGAQTVLDNLNKSLADKAIPALRKKAVSKEKLDRKASKSVKSVSPKVEPEKKKRVVKKRVSTKKASSVGTAEAVKKVSASTSSGKASPIKK